MNKKILAFFLVTLCWLSLSVGLAEEATPTAGGNGSPVVADVEVRFGYDGDPYILHMYDNDTAVALVRALGDTSTNLPIYNYEGFEGSEYMQYYDIPGRYEISASPETITDVKAGEVYYSHPNRVVLIYRDAQMAGEYTPVGYIDTDASFTDVVDQNPVLEGWGNKIISVRRVTE